MTTAAPRKPAVKPSVKLTPEQEATAAILAKPIDFDCSIVDRAFPFWIEQLGGDGLNSHGQFHYTNEANARTYAAKLNELNPRWKFQVYTWNPQWLADKTGPKGVALP